MGFKGLPSEERFGNVTVQPPVAPKHTTDGHEQCAYYITEDNDGFMYCIHDKKAHHAFYSEDYVKEMRQRAQVFLNEVDSLLHGHPNPSILLPSIKEYREYFK